MSNWKSDKQKEIEGTLRNDRVKKSPIKRQTITTIPQLPKNTYLNEIGKKHFKTICRTLIQQTRLHESDIILIIQLSFQYQIIETCLSSIGSNYQVECGQFQTIIDGEKTYIPIFQNNTLFTLYYKAIDAIVKLSAKLAITPIDETRLNISPETPKSGALDLID